MLTLPSLKRFFALGLLTACCLSTSSAPAQSRPARITAAVSNAERVTLSGSAHPMAQAQFESGRMASDAKLSGISLYFNRSEAQETGLQALLAAQQDPASPLYHQWLTPEQFGARFGMSDADLAKVTAWLQQQGFAIDSVASNRSVLRFSGTISQIEQAFQTEMHYYTVDGEKRFAPSGNLSLPAAFSPVVSTLHNLDSFRPQPMLKNPTLAQPNLTTTSGSVYFSPADIDTVYNVTLLRSAGYTGAGQTITIVGQSAIYTDDIARFQSAAGLTQKLPTLVLVPGSGTSAIGSTVDHSESDLDLEWSNAIAPGANVYFVYTGNNSNYDVFDSIVYAIEQKIGNILSISYGGCETANSTWIAAYDSTYLAQASTQGQSIFASSGDSGATGCYVHDSLTTTVRQSLNVSYPASSPYVTAVGGTEIDKSNSAYMTAGGSYWTANSGSSELVSSAKQYIPEVVWNDDSSSSVSAGGGGVSSTFAKPSYQTALTTADSYRDVPDVSLFSSSSYPGYIFCSSAYTGTCTNGFATSSGSYLRSGGTSFAAPIFAAMTALVAQKNGYTKGTGPVNTNLYTLASSSGSTSSGSYTASAGFHDITSGTIACSSAASSLCGSKGGASAAAGYDMASGLGSVDLYTLANAWPAASYSLAASVSTVTAPSSTLYTGTTYTYTVTVAPLSGSTVPTGTVTLSIDGGGSDYSNSGSTATVTLGSTGTATYSLSFSSTGTHQIVARYAGDSSFAPSTTVLPITLSTATTVGTTTTVTPSATSVSTGTSVSFAVAVAAASGSTTPTGNVVITVDGASVGTYALTSGASTYSTSFSSAGTHTVTAAYQGSSAFSTSSGSASVTVTSSSSLISTTTTVTPSATSATTGTTVSFAVAVAAASGSTTPSGNVVITVDGSSVGTYALTSGASTYSTSFSSAGTHTITAAYQGSSAFSTSSGSASVTVTTASTSCSGSNCFTLSVSSGSTSSSPLTITQGSSGSTTVTITSQNSYAGTVAFGLSSSSSSFVSYGCFNASSKAVTANSTATTTLTVYTIPCSSVSAVQNSQPLHAIASAGAQPLQTASALHPVRALLPLGGVAMAGLLLFGLRRRASRIGLVGCLLLAGALSMAITSCGGGNSTSNSTTTTTTTTTVPKGSYTLTLTGTDSSTSSITNTTSVYITVN